MGQLRGNQWGLVAAVVSVCNIVLLVFITKDWLIEQRNNNAILKILAISNQPAEQKSICFIHVGKAGGSTISKALKRLQRFNDIKDYIQIHLKTDRPHLNKRMASFMAQRHEYRALGTGHLNACFNLGLTRIWVRDPVSRLISTWNFHDCAGLKKQTECSSMLLSKIEETAITRQPNIITMGETVHGSVDLDSTIIEIAETNNTAVEHLFYRCIPHATASISFYIPDCSNLINSTRTDWFIGRNEALYDDWDMLLREKIGLVMRHFHKPGHKHRTLTTAGKRLSLRAILRIRSYFTNDYQCIRQLTEQGLLTPAYLADITSISKDYIY